MYSLKPYLFSLIVNIIFLLSPFWVYCQKNADSSKQFLKSYTSIESSLSGNSLKYNQAVLGKRLDMGFRVGLTYAFVLNRGFEFYSGVEYSELGNKYFRVFPTGIKDTINVYNTIQIFEEKIHLHYLNFRFGIRNEIWSSNSISLFSSANIFGGLLLGSRYVAHELSGNAFYNTRINFYRRTNWGAQVSIGSKLHLLNRKFFMVTVSYELGIPNIYIPNTALGQLPQTSQFTRALSLTLSVPFLQTNKQFTSL